MAELSTSLKTRIKDSIALHQSFLAEQASLDYNESDLRGARANLEDFKSQESDLSDRLNDLRRISSRQHEASKELQNSKLSRFLVRARSGGSRRKLEARLEAHQAEFEEAHRVENEAQSSLRALQAAIEETTARVTDLKTKQYRVSDLEKSLDTLYARVFDDESVPSIPEEEEARMASRKADKEAKLADVSRMRHETVFGYLEQARRALTRAQEKAQQSLLVVNVAWSASDETRRHLLHIARDECITAAQCFKRACEGCNEVVALPQKDISGPGCKIFNNVLNELISSDDLMRRRISHGTISLHYAISHTLVQEASQINRLKAARSIAATTATHAKNAKMELTAIRRRIILDVAAADRPLAETSDLMPPPTYQTDSLPAY